MVDKLFDSYLCKKIIVSFFFVLVLKPIFSQELVENNNFNAQVADSILVKQSPLRAVREFKDALKALPENQDIKFYIAKAYGLIPDHDKALYWLSQIIKDDADVEKKILELYIDELEAVGRFEVARLWMEKSKLDLYNYNQETASVANARSLLKDTSFIKVTRLDINSRKSDFCPTFYKNGLVFYSNRENTKEKKVDFINNTEADIFYSDIKNGVFAEPVDFNSLIGYGYFEGAFTFYNNNTKMYVSKYMTSQNSNIKEQDKLMGLRLYDSNIDTATNRLYTLDPLPFNIHGFSFAHPTASTDGNTLLFSSNIPGSKGGSDLYLVKSQDGVWLPPVNLGDKINTPYDEYFPYLFQDSILFFTSNRPGGYGKFDIYKANLNSDEDVENLGSPINSEYDDFSFIVSNDGLRGFFSTNRDEQFNEDIYGFELVTVSVQKLIEEILGEGALDYLDISYSEGSRIMHKPTDKKENPADAAVTSAVDDSGSQSQSFVENNPQTTISLNLKNSLQTVDPDAEDENSEGINGQIIIKRGDQVIEKITVPDQVNIGNFFKLKQEINERLGNLSKEKLIESDSDTKNKKQITDLVFRVQIAASKHELSNKDLKRKYKGERPVLMFSEEGWYKYYIGEFENYFVADKIKKESGVQDAFIAAYKQDDKLVLMDALRSQYKTEKEDYKLLDSGIPPQWDVVEKQVLYFDFNSFEESGLSSKPLGDIVRLLEENQNLQLAVFAYADYWGSADYNLALSAERGKTVKKHLIGRGIAENRITVKSFGEKFTGDKDTQPQLYNKQENKTNRKVEFIVYKIK